MIRLVHLTDPHLTVPPPALSLVRRSHFGKRYLGRASWTRRRRHVLTPASLEALLAEVGAWQADQLILTGDLAQIGTREEIEVAGGWLHRLASPDRLLLVPGNHDVYAADSPAALESYWTDYLPQGGMSAYPVVRAVGDVVLFGISSAVPTAPWSATGRLGAVQLERLQQALARYRSAFRVLAIHHPPLPGAVRYRKRLVDADRLAAVLAREPVQLVLHGHSHRNQERDVGGMRVFGTAPASAPDASFRVFDIRQLATGWHVETVRAERQRDTFVEQERQSWRVSGPG